MNEGVNYQKGAFVWASCKNSQTGFKVLSVYLDNKRNFRIRSLLLVNYIIIVSSKIASMNFVQ